MEIQQPGTIRTTLALFAAAALLMSLLWLAIDSNHFHIVHATTTPTVHSTATK
jgi:hypothetical protein